MIEPDNFILKSYITPKDKNLLMLLQDQSLLKLQMK